MSGTHLHGSSLNPIYYNLNFSSQIGPAASIGGLGRRTMWEALEISSELQTKYVDLGEFAKYSCFDVNKLFPIPLRGEVNSDDEVAIMISNDGVMKLKKNVDLDELDSRELKRIKIIKKRRKFQNSLLCTNNLI